MSTRRALALSFADRYAGLVLAIVSSVLIARLLKPEEIGAFSVVMVLVTLVTALRDFGAGQYLLQEKELTPARIQATWSVLLATGGFFALVVALAAWPVAAFYEDQRIVGMMLVLSLSFVINPVGSLSYAWLMREMRFDALAAMRLGAGITGAVVSVGLAWLGHGPISLALGTLASTIVNALIALRWRPASFSWRTNFSEARRVMSFGGRISATAFVTNLGNGVPELILGKVQSLAHAAYYSRAFGLAGMFQKMVLDAAQSVAMPVFAKSFREGEKIGPWLHLSTAYACALGWSFFISLALLAHPVVLLLYGPQWVEAVEIVRWLAVAMAIGLPSVMVPIALNASGAVGTTMKITFALVGVQGLLVGVAAAQGLRAIGCAFVLGQAIALVLWWRMARLKLDVELKSGGKQLVKSLAVSAAAASPALMSCLLLGWKPEAPMAVVLTATIAGLGTMAATAFALEHPLAREVRALARRLLREPDR